jgi:uncharacterized Zn-binding protein involved in type VI secretion
MGQAVSRLGDICSGHGCFPPRTSVEASSDVFVNGLAVTRVGDHWDTHCCTIICHDGVGEQGSSTVFVNGKAVMRIGDAISCGSVSAQGSSDTFFG